MFLSTTMTRDDSTLIKTFGGIVSYVPCHLPGTDGQVRVEKDEGLRGVDVRLFGNGRKSKD